MQLLCMLASAQLLLSFAEQEQEQAEHAQVPEQNLRFAEGEPKSDLVALRFC